MSRIYPILAALSLVIVAGCTKEPNPGDPSGNNGAKKEVAVARLSPLPADSGNTTSIAIASDNSFIALMDGRLVAIDAAGAVRTINGDATHLEVAISPSGDIYAVTATELRRYDATTGSMVSSPIPENGPLATNGRVEGAEIRFSPAGEPFVTLISNYPHTYTYFSTDRGGTWRPLPFPSGRSSLAFSGDVIFTRSGDLLAGDYQGLYRSTDRGASWTLLTAQMPNFAIKLLATSNGDIYRYIPGGGNLSVSHNGGSTFTDITPVNRPPFFTALQEGPDGALYALANSSSTGTLTIDRPMHLIRSTDGGANWKHIIYSQAYDFAMRGQTIAIAAAGTSFSFNRGPGGIQLSRDLGATWTTVGLGEAGTIQDFGFDDAGNLMLLADHALYRRTASGWTTLGSQPGSFLRFASGHGRMLVAGTTSFYLTTDNGATWSEGSYPDYLPAGNGSIEVSDVIALRSGEFLVSITTYRLDLSTHTNGQLYRIGADGVAHKLGGPGQTLERLIEDPDGVVHGTGQTLDPITVTFSTQGYRSSDGGNSWTDETTPSPAQAYNSARRFFRFGGGNGATFSLGSIGSSETTPLTLTGFDALPQSITQVMFGPDDRLYLLTSGGAGLFVSSAAVK
jgi:photosystem II stability/assembly factor-like uncharacterized protein